ncbi:hypothetical protein AAFF_G00108500 [Aldrovandia affinis]|uniref:Uncharacterized protein n=1 Tax=Aldrovandia affinis TaxID=143900 RepID=A0AAD7WAT3_9TELE|nr:hypothetical protein AAFF_G00108500 [Aldrovandia affinis]
MRRRGNGSWDPEPGGAARLHVVGGRAATLLSQRDEAGDDTHHGHCPSTRSEVDEAEEKQIVCVFANVALSGYTAVRLCQNNRGRAKTTLGRERFFSRRAIRGWTSAITRSVVTCDAVLLVRLAFRSGYNNYSAGRGRRSHCLIADLKHL